MFSETHSSKMRTCFSSLFVTLHWVKHHNLCNWTGIHSNIGLHSDVFELDHLVLRKHWWSYRYSSFHRLYLDFWLPQSRLLKHFISLGINDRNTSLIHHFHLVFQKGPYGIYGIQDDARPRSTSFRERYDPPSGSFGIQPIGHWFMRLATSYRHLWNSNCINTCSPIAFFFRVNRLLAGLNYVFGCHKAMHRWWARKQASQTLTF